MIDVNPNDVWWKRVDQHKQNVYELAQKLNVFMLAVESSYWPELIKVYEYAEIFVKLSSELDAILKAEVDR